MYKSNHKICIFTQYSCFSVSIQHPLVNSSANQRKSRIRREPMVAVFLVACGEKSNKSIQIFQIFLFFLICMICDDLWDFCAKRTPFLSRLRREPTVTVREARESKSFNFFICMTDITKWQHNPSKKMITGKKSQWPFDYLLSNEAQNLLCTQWR